MHSKQDIFSKLSYSGRYIKCGKFEVILPEVFGFCGGVIRALKLLDETVSASPGRKIFLLGEIIHNDNVNAYFREKGVIVVPHKEIKQILSVAAAEDIITIPAFGIKSDLEIKIRNKFKTILDTTCKNVKRVWNFVEGESADGTTILIHGRLLHPEVEVIISRAAAESVVVVIPDLKTAKVFADFLKLQSSSTKFPEGIFISNSKKFNWRKMAMANQTTMLFNETAEIEKMLKNALSPDCKFTMCKTTCKAAYDRQKAAEKLLKEEHPDAVLVVGGFDSSNTNNLYFQAKQTYPAFYIKDSSSISIKNNKIEHYLPTENKIVHTSLPDAFSSAKRIGILSGASCPAEIVNSLIKRLKELSM